MGECDEVERDGVEWNGMSGREWTQIYQLKQSLNKMHEAKYSSEQYQSFNLSL